MLKPLALPTLTKLMARGSGLTRYRSPRLFLVTRLVDIINPKKVKGSNRACHVEGRIFKVLCSSY